MAETQDASKQTARQDDDKAHHALDTKLLLRMASYLVPYKFAAISCVVISLAVAGLKLAQPIVIHRLIDKEVAAGDFPGVAAMSLAFLALIVLTLVLDVIFNYVTGVVGQKSMHDLRMAIFRHVERLDIPFFDRNPVGRLVTRMTSDVSTLNDLFSSGVIAMGAEIFMILGVMGVMFFYSVKLTLVVLCALPPMLIVLAIFRKHMRKWYLETRGRIAKMNAFLQENVAGMRTVQSFNRETRNFETFHNLNDQYCRAQVQTIFGFALFYPAVNVISNLTLATAIWVGGRDVIEGRILGNGNLSFGTLFLFVQCVNMLFTPLRNLSERYNLLQSAMASAARIFGLLDTPPKITAPENALPPPEKIVSGIRFEEVGFEYVAGEAVLTGINFEIKPGQTVAVVGHTGAGKSTLINLLARFYDPTSGRITVDGNDIRRFDPLALRRMFAVVLQEVFLFSGTIASNLRMGNPDLTDDDIWELLREVRADDFARGLDGGVNAIVRERGGTFSTGQKQLLSFARALAADPQVLILDEATANVDTETEGRIQEAIARLLQGRTALVIAHRISTIQKADLILVMHKGHLRESGTHRELIERDGLYRRLYELQYQNGGEQFAANS